MSAEAKVSMVDAVPRLKQDTENAVTCRLSLYHPREIKKSKIYIINRDYIIWCGTRARARVEYFWVEIIWAVICLRKWMKM